MDKIGPKIINQDVPFGWIENSLMWMRSILSIWYGAGCVEAVGDCLERKDFPGGGDVVGLQGASSAIRVGSSAQLRTRSARLHHRDIFDGITLWGVTLVND